jgi:hypothetical protein
MEWQLKGRKVELADYKTIKRYMKDLKKLLMENKLLEKRAFIKSFTKEVNVHDKKASLKYTILCHQRVRRCQFCLLYTMVGHCGLEPQTLPILSGCSNLLNSQFHAHILGVLPALYFSFPPNGLQTC